MATIPNAAIPEPSTTRGRDARTRRDRAFFGGMAIPLALVVFVGFAPTFYLRGALDTSDELSPSLVWHGVAFSAWMVLLMIQTSLIAARRADLHRLLGAAGVVLGVVMMVLGAYVAITRTRDGLFVNPAGIPPLRFMAVPLATIVVFPVLFGAAFWLRRRTDFHKRLVLIATFELITAGVARLPVVSTLGPPGFFGGTDLFLLALVAYDIATLKRVHPATLWGGLFLLASQPLRLAIAGTEPWLAFAGWLTSF